jgi:hypothetical protein
VTLAHDTPQGHSRHTAQGRRLFLGHSLTHQWLYSSVYDPAGIFSFEIIFVIDTDSLDGGSALARPIPTQNRRTLAYMPRVGFERATAADGPDGMDSLPVSITHNTLYRYLTHGCSACQYHTQHTVPMPNTRLLCLSVSHTTHCTDT